MSFAQVVLQADVLGPKRALSEDERGYYSVEGSIYPDDRHILVSPSVSTIVQFRNLDYGLERCALIVVVPSVAMSHNSATRLHPADGVTLDIWELDAEEEFTPFRPRTWSVAPKRRALHKSIVLHENSSMELDKFFCPSGHFSTFEVSCTTGLQCLVDFWQVKGYPLNGFSMKQYDSTHHE